MNKVELLGRLTRDPELRTTPNGISVLSFSIAVDRRFKNKDGEKEVDFINCVAWRQTAEFISKYFTKGKMIAVCGTLQTRTWDDADGKKRYATDVVVDETYFAGASNESKPKTQNATPAVEDIPDGFAPYDDGSEDDLPF